MKPSRDYIDWLMAPEQKEFRRRLNEEWQPSIGDWAILRGEHVTKRPQLVVATGYEGGVVYTLGHTTNAKATDRFDWLPDLGQLLDLIEAAHEPGYGLYKRYARDGGGYSVYAKDAAEYTVAERPEIAAASLLAKLWEVEWCDL